MEADAEKSAYDSQGQEYTLESGKSARVTLDSVVEEKSVTPTSVSKINSDRVKQKSTGDKSEKPSTTANQNAKPMNDRQKSAHNKPTSTQQISTPRPSYTLTEDLIDISDSQKITLNSARGRKDEDVICSKHEGAQVIMYCRTCDRLVCDECITKVHKPHNLTEIRKQAQHDRPILKEKLPDVRARAIPALKKNLEILTDTKTKAAAEFDGLIHQIGQRSFRLISAIETAKERLINQTKADKNASCKFLQKLEDKMAAGIKGLETSVTTSDEAMGNNNDSEIVHERIQLQWLLNRYRKSQPNLTFPKFHDGTAPQEEATLEKMIGYFEGILKCEAKDQTHKIMLNVMPLGTLKPTYITTIPYIHKIRAACEADHDKICIVPVVSITSFDIFSQDGTSLLVQVPDIRIYDISRTMDNQFLISDARSRQIMRITSSGVVINSVDIKGIPRGVHACKNGDILVCVVDSVGFTNSKKATRLIIRFNESFKVMEIYGNRERIFNVPDRIYENANGDICVIDRTGGLDSRLVVLNSHGSVRFEYPKERTFDLEYGEEYLPKKRHAFSDVCCDGYANIYICDERSGDIVVLDADGNEQKDVADILMKKRDKIGTNISAPHRMVIDHIGRLWIIQRRKLTLFSLFH